MSGLIPNYLSLIRSRLSNRGVKDRKLKEVLNEVMMKKKTKLMMILTLILMVHAWKIVKS